MFLRHVRPPVRSILFPVLIAALLLAGPDASALDRETAARMESQFAALLTLADSLPPQAREELVLRVATLRGLLASALPVQPAARAAVPDSEMPGILAKLRDAWPFSGQRRLLALYASNRSFSVAQIREILDLVPFSQDRKETLALLLPGTRDPENIDLLYGIFWTKDDKDYLHSLLGVR